MIVTVPGEVDAKYPGNSEKEKLQPMERDKKWRRWLF